MTSTLHLRIATTAVGLPIIFGCVLLGPAFTAGLATIVAIVAVFEWTRLARSFDYPPSALFSAVLAVGIIQASVWGSLQLLLAAVAASIAIGVFHFTAPGPGLGRTLRVGGAMSSIVIGFAFGAFVQMRASDFGLEMAATALLCTFAVDTSAYAVGKRFGRRPLAPTISPNKTWEGAIGGGVAGVLTAIGLIIAFGIPAPIWAAAGLGVVIGVASHWGDLNVSLMKRLAEVKDSGNLLPGHGGVLDRVDSLLLALPMAYTWHTIVLVFNR